MERAICFTGHRVLPKQQLPALLRELNHILETAITQGFVDFYTGGALGWDTYCAQLVLDLRENYPGIALHLVLPCPREEQTARWNERQRLAYDCIYRQADSCEFVSEGYTSSCMRKRNQRLVTLSDCCICYCREPEGYSGTAQTIRMARQKGIPIINLFEEEGKKASLERMISHSAGKCQRS